MRHNAVRDTTAELLTEVCKDIKVEPCLLPVAGGEDLSAGSIIADGARSDVSALSFWNPLCRAFFIERHLILLLKPTGRRKSQPCIPSMKN